MGWSEHFARDWPIESIVAENGAVALFRDGDRVSVEYAQDAPTRERNAQRLSGVAERVLRQVPGTALSRDSAGRVTDIAIDHGEFAQLTPQQVAEVLRVMHAE